MSTPKSTKVIINANPPTAEIKPDTFKLVSRDISSLEDGQILIKTTAFSNDPAQRGWIDGAMDQRRMYIPLVKKDEPIKATILGEVVASRSDKWKQGQTVTGMGYWAEYVVGSGDNFRPVVTVKGHSPFIALGNLGSTGQTAWAGAFDIAKLKKEQTVLVSGAAGAVGSIFLQIAKHVIGCEKVVGIAGGKEKCDWVKKIGADECLDYKDKDFAQNLKKALPDYADVYFDNVGGDILDEALTVVKRYGLVVACGAISTYHGEGMQLKNWFEVIANRITIKGMILTDHLKDLPRATQELKGWIEEGKINVDDGETVVDTKFEDLPKTWQLLFKGGNKGKLISKLV